ncbi:MAG: hypothetical protein KDE63_13300, partial [Novosphingobium sp.]|nr:hypothetical protein [Novosphingobium sp.]
MQGGDADLKSLEEMSRSYLEMLGIDASAHEIARPDGEAPADWFLRQIAIINAASGLPVHDSPKAIRRDDDIVYCIAPTLNSIADSMRALIVGFANHLRLSASDPERNRLAKAMKLHFGKLTGHANGRTNPHRLMSAAWE